MSLPCSCRLMSLPCSASPLWSRPCLPLQSSCYHTLPLWPDAPPGVFQLPVPSRLSSRLLYTFLLPEMFFSPTLQLLQVSACVSLSGVLFLTTKLSPLIFPSHRTLDPPLIIYLYDICNPYQMVNIMKAGSCQFSSLYTLCLVQCLGYIVYMQEVSVNEWMNEIGKYSVSKMYVV